MKHILNKVISIFILFFMANWCHAEGTWVLVTNVSDLQTGDKVIIVARDYDRAMAISASGATYQPSVGVTLEGETCIVNDEVQILDVTSNTDGTFNFKVGDKFLCADKSGKNNLMVKGKSDDDYPNWNITIEGGVTKIKAKVTSASIPSLIQYNQPYNRFSCYLYEAKDLFQVSLYKFVEGQGEVKEPAEIILVDAGKQSSDTIKTYIGSSDSLPTRGSSVEGHEFMGWSRTPIVAGASIPSGTLLSPGSSVKVEENLIFYAVYAKPVYNGEKAYVKIEGEQADWSGIYLIVCESAGKVFNGSLGFTKENAVDVEISENKIAFNDETKLYEFRIEKYGDGYSIKSDTSKYYIGSKGGESWSSKTLSSEGKFTISCSDKPLKANSAYLWYMSKKFAFSYSTNNPIQLYKRTDVTKSYAYYTTFASISVNSYGYATWYSGIPVEVPAGVTAYTCQVEGNTAMLHAVGAVVPAHTGVVLYAPEAVGKGQTFVLRYADVDTTPIANNALIGFVEDTEVNNGKAHYALNVKDKKVGFYIPKTTTTENAPSATSAFTAKAGKAYLELESASATSFTLHRGEASIAVSISTSSDDIVYDLMGRKVSAPSKGIYIVNGRKVVLTGEDNKTE